MNDDRGSLTAFLAILSAGLFVLIGLVIDGGSAIEAKRQAVDVANEAARVGADQLSVDDLRAGQFVVDPTAATEAVLSYLAAADASGSVSVSGDSVTVRVTAHVPTSVLGIVGISDIPVSATATSIDLHGVTEEDP